MRRTVAGSVTVATTRSLAFLARPYEPKVDPNADLDRKEPRFSARIDGFDVRCAVRIAANDDVRRERLVRYCARPPLSLDRIEVQRDGRIAFRLKQPRKGRTYRVMDPLSFMARLAAQTPHPKLPLISSFSHAWMAFDFGMLQ